MLGSFPPVVMQLQLQRSAFWKGFWWAGGAAFDWSNNHQHHFFVFFFFLPFSPPSSSLGASASHVQEHGPLLTF